VTTGVDRRGTAAHALGPKVSPAGVLVTLQVRTAQQCYEIAVWLL
jgi:hypothetical protein